MSKYKPSTRELKHFMSMSEKDKRIRPGFHRAKRKSVKVKDNTIYEEIVIIEDEGGIHEKVD